MGHLNEAAVAHFEATGKRTLLDVATWSANLLVHTFGPHARSIWPGHPITELALMRLARATGDQRYLELARFLLDERDPDGEPNSANTFNQSHLPVREQSEAVGHAVRAMFLYAGTADVAMQEGPSSSYVPAFDLLWNDVDARKPYISGGMGAILSAVETCPSYKPWHDKTTHETFLRPDTDRESNSSRLRLVRLRLGTREFLRGYMTSKRSES